MRMTLEGEREESERRKRFGYQSPKGLKVPGAFASHL
jgi:hypothetical protein